MPREKSEKVTADHVVVLRYTLTDDDGRVLDEADDASPFVYLHGYGALLPALEEGLTDREVGAPFELTLSGAEAFGAPRPDPLRVVPRDVLPLDAEPAAGFQLSIRDDDEVFPAWVVRSSGAHLVVSLAHPFAADPVHVSAEVLKIRAATPEELERGWATQVDAG